MSLEHTQGAQQPEPPVSPEHNPRARLIPDFIPHPRPLAIASIISLIGLGFVWHGSIGNGAGHAFAWATKSSSWKLLSTIIFGLALVVVVTTLVRGFIASKSQAEERFAMQSVADITEEDKKLEALLRHNSAQRKHKENKTILVSIILVVLFGILAGLFVFLTTPEISDRPPSRSTQSIQSAALISALSGGAITLWISNRRRRHDEETLEQSREELEQTRDSSAAQLDLSRQRAEDERFTAAIELLGHDSASVRVGALHVLYGLANTAPARRQTIVDVMSAYLRQPFFHPHWKRGGDSEDQGATTPQDRELEVRRTAQRLIIELVHSQAKLIEFANPLSARVLFVDLTGAHLDGLLLQNQPVRLKATRAQFHGDVNLGGSRLYGSADFEGATFHGQADMQKTYFVEGSRFAKAEFYGRTSFFGALFGLHARFDNAKFHRPAVFRKAKFPMGFSVAGAIFESIAFFNDAKFGLAAEFDGTRFARQAHFIDCTFNDATFEDAAFHLTVSFSSAKVAGTLAFSMTEFIGSARFNSMTIEKSDPEKGVRFEKTRFWKTLTILGTDPQKIHFDDAMFADERQRPASTNK